MFRKTLICGGERTVEARKALHHPLPQLFQRVLRAAPDDSVIPQREEHGAQQRVDEQSRTNGMKKEVIRRDRGPPGDSDIDREQRSESDSKRQALPSVGEPDPEEWPKIEERQTEC